MFGERNTPTLLYSFYSPDFGFSTENEGPTTQIGPNGGFFWDGRADFLADQASGPFLGSHEMNNPSREAVVAKVRDGAYADQMRQVFGADVFADDARAYQRIVSAIATYEQSPRFRPFTSRFDDFLRGREQLTEQEARGFALFQDPQKGNCINCHAGRAGSHNPQDWLFTNFGFENLGVPRNRAIPANSDPSHFDLGLCARGDLAQHAPAGSDVSQYCGFFKTPTLRNVAITAPYMHNGYFTDLREAVRFYATRDTDAAHWYPRAADGTVQRYDDVPPRYQANVNSEVPMDRHPGETPRLTDSEIDDIVAFLRTLTDR
jgi:cytochrome c peroxidase